MTENRDTYIPGDPTAPPTDGIPVLEDTDQPVRDIAGAEVDTDEPVADAIIGTRVSFDIPDELLDKAEAQFFTASEDQRVVQLRTAIQVVAALIHEHVPSGRHRSVAFTALEDVQMRANRGIFAPPEHR